MSLIGLSPEDKAMSNRTEMQAIPRIKKTKSFKSIAEKAF